MAVIGHGQVVEHLRSDTPQVSLLLGPSSVGKTTVAEEVFESLGVSGAMLRRFEALRIADARSITSFTSRRSSLPKGAIVQLDGATDEATNAMLKVLEEPPSATYFMLCASTPPPLTIVSRSQVFRLGYLTDAEVARVLMSTKPVLSLERAEKAARSAGGQVSRAREMARLEESKGPVLSVLHAVAFGDEELFSNAIGGKREIEINGSKRREDTFGPTQWRLLRTWAREALSGRWRAFSPAESYGLQKSPEVASRVLRMGDVSRPKVGVRCALLPFIWEKRRG
jgi:hypothetical protein